MCNIDAVIGDQSGFPIKFGFLEGMHKHWFQGKQKPN